MKKITQQEFNALPVNEFGIKMCPGDTDYSCIKIGERCSFGDGCSFGVGCSFGERCRFGEWCRFKNVPISILTARLDDVSDSITLELMRRDANFHPNPEKFDEWAAGGPCPYTKSLCQQAHHFTIKKSLWVPGKPTMTDYELLMAIAAEKKWKIGE